MSYTQWTGHDENEWKPVSSTTAELPPGFYAINQRDSAFSSEVFLSKQTPRHDNAIVVADSISNHIINSIKTFRSKGPDYARFKLLHKRGMLLHGPAGSGKTMSAMLAGEWHVSQGGIAVYPAVAEWFDAMPKILNDVRTVHPELHILCILEDIDTKPYQREVETLLSLLDGHYQIDRVYYICTTNHIDDIDERLTNRPKRLDEVIYVGPPSEAARRSYLDGIVPADQPMRKEVITQLAHFSEGLMLAHLSDLMISYLVLDQPLEVAAKRLKEMNTPPTDDDIMGNRASGSITLAIDADTLQEMARQQRRKK